jgi:hypothetical protein
VRLSVFFQENLMVIDPSSAQHFIDGYQSFLIALANRSGKSVASSGLQLMAESRLAFVQDRTLIDSTAHELAQAGHAVADDVLAAIKSLQLKSWVYLRDTKQYSVFIDPEQDKAYAVLGLTQPISEVLGGSGVMIETGVMAYQGRYVCDAIFTGQVVWLGTGYRKSFAESLASIKKQKQFYKVPELPEVAGRTG